MDDESDKPKRGPGRPPKLKECPACHELRKTVDFGSSRLCRACRAIGAPDPAYVPPERRFEVPSATRGEELLSESTGFISMQRVIAQVCAGFARCACCLTAEHVRQIGDRHFCALCAVTVETCGRCVEHHSVVFFEELVGGPEPYVPPDVRALFDAPDVLRRLRSSDPVNASPEP